MSEKELRLTAHHAELREGLSRLADNWDYWTQYHRERQQHWEGEGRNLYFAYTHQKQADLLEEHARLIRTLLDV